MKTGGLMYNNKVTNDFILSLRKRGATNGVKIRNPIRSIDAYVTPILIAFQ